MNGTMTAIFIDPTTVQVKPEEIQYVISYTDTLNNEYTLHSGLYMGEKLWPCLKQGLSKTTLTFTFDEAQEIIDEYKTGNQVKTIDDLSVDATLREQLIIQMGDNIMTSGTTINKEAAASLAEKFEVKPVLNAFRFLS